MPDTSDDSQAAGRPRSEAAAAYLVYVLYIVGFFTGLVSFAVLAMTDGLHHFVVARVFECDTVVPACSASVYGLPFFAGITSLAALILAYAKRAGARGHWLESHYTWQIMIFWYWLAIGVIGMALLMLWVLLGYVLVLGTIWGVYRLAKGWRLLGTCAPFENPKSFF